MSNLIRAKETTLASLLREGCFNVPWHQRSYDWEEEHVNTLLLDLAEAVNEKRPCHFLGSIMLIKNDVRNKWEINDGQQRIITFSLICAYLCRSFNERGDSAEENKILRVLFDISESHNETLQNADSLSIRVNPPKNNKTYFNHLIRGHDVGINGKMISAWKSIVSFLESAEHKHLSWRKKMLNFMLNEVVVIRLEVDKSLDPNAIFETLNYRGKYLEQVDLIKNYFLSFFNDQKESVRQETVHANIEEIETGFNNNIKTVSEYVRCHMQAQYGFIHKERIFRETKNRFNNVRNGKPDQVFSIVESLAKKQRVQIFKTLQRKSTNRDFIKQLTIDAKKTNNKRNMEDYLLDLHTYKITNPIMFALFCCYFEADKSKKPETAKFAYNCAKLLSSFVQRVAHIGDFKPSVYEENFANLAMDIFKGKCTTAKDFFECLQTYDKVEIIDDKNYMAQMETKFYPGNSVTKSGYILRRIVEYQETGRKLNDNQISIEHILPKSKIHSSKIGWTTEFDSADHDRLRHCLGNLTVLSKSENSPKESDNESFAAKKKIFATSLYKMTKELSGYPTWTSKIVRDRQRKLAKIAAKNIWNFDF